MEMPRPGPGHSRLNRLAGTWDGEERMHPSPWNPVGGSATAVVTNTLALDGFAVVQDYEQRRGGDISLRGHAVVRYDEFGARYAMYWFDSMGTPPAVFEGTFEGDVLDLSTSYPGGEMRARFVFRDDTAYDYTMELSADGAQWTPFMDGHYRRRAS